MRRWLATVCLLLLFTSGIAALGAAGLCAYRSHLATSPSGLTAGGAASAADLCRRSTPPDVAAACLAELSRTDAAERARALRWGGLGLGCLLAAAGLWLWLRHRGAGRAPTR
jgi:hypothetical protein